ncbi:neuromedin-U [Synchiropus splendidus]|uniref:neuromedin-U n=1 Tax=Synchiropus splendidus TaxID=270530 RepID=UPI00237E45E0|nr:neuromedin-U [Synchiropus splendidus]
MKTHHYQYLLAQRAVSSSPFSLSMSPLITASITLAALLIFTVPSCTGLPAELQSTVSKRDLLSQIEAVCSSYHLADRKFLASDFFGELCVMMLVQGSKEFLGREKSKRAEPQRPAGIQSRGHFLYRPRNGRRSTVYDY